MEREGAEGVEGGAVGGHVVAALAHPWKKREGDERAGRESSLGKRAGRRGPIGCKEEYAGNDDEEEEEEAGGEEEVPPSPSQAHLPECLQQSYFGL